MAYGHKSSSRDPLIAGFAYLRETNRQVLCTFIFPIFVDFFKTFIFQNLIKINMMGKMLRFHSVKKKHTKKHTT